MDFSTVKGYLNGTDFSNSLKVKVSKRESNVPYRMEVIQKIVKDKDVIHFGCADHIEVIDFKIKKNIWLHKLIADVAKKVTGIDINKEAVEYLTNNLKIPGIYCLNIEEQALPLELTGNKSDFLVMGEIIEHIDNPVQFLSSVRNKFSGIATEILVTAPNALRWLNFKYAFKHTELINSDHRFWFTPYTLGKILARAGYHDISFQFVENSRPDKFSPRKYFIYRYYPSFRDTVLIRAKL
jgi:2-polyprenyl-3-methyl-5-hydroxy-6-metoxy-1,4-benzoquinol methylase